MKKAPDIRSSCPTTFMPRKSETRGRRSRTRTRGPVSKSVGRVRVREAPCDFNGGPFWDRDP